jgi:hypothetical protein
MRVCTASSFSRRELHHRHRHVLKGSVFPPVLTSVALLVSFAVPCLKSRLPVTARPPVALIGVCSCVTDSQHRVPFTEFFPVQSLAFLKVLF